MPTETYQYCRCPHCKLPLDYLRVEEETCPRCQKVLEPDAVWATRKYPGSFTIPGWVSAFTWPVLLMGVGVYLFVGGVEIIGTLVMSIGLIFFLFKLHYGREV